MNVCVGDCDGLIFDGDAAAAAAATEAMAVETHG